MELQLCVTVETDPEGTQVRLVVTGQLIKSDHRALFLLAKRVRALSARTEVVVDLTAAKFVESSAVDFLIWGIDHHEASATDRPVGIELSTPPASASGAGALPGRRTLWTRANRRDPGHDS